MKLTPLHDRILVERVPEEERKGVIYIPDAAKEKPQEGIVVAVGDGQRNEDGQVFPLSVKEGDRVLFGKYAGSEVQVEEKQLLIMREEEVLGILSESAAGKLRRAK